MKTNAPSFSSYLKILPLDFIVENKHSVVNERNEVVFYIKNSCYRMNKTVEAFDTNGENLLTVKSLFSRPFCKSILSKNKVIGSFIKFINIPFVRIFSLKLNGKKYLIRQNKSKFIVYSLKNGFNNKLLVAEAGKNLLDGGTFSIKYDSSLSDFVPLSVIIFLVSTLSIK